MEHMEKIRYLTDEAWGELNGADAYIGRAMKFRGVDRMMSETYAEMAAQELEHVDKLLALGNHVFSDSGTDHMVKEIWDWMVDSVTSRKAELMAKLTMSRK